MKNIIIAALVILASTSAFASDPSSVKVVSKKLDVVYFKVSEDLIGAEIEVQDWTGKVIHTEKVIEKKVLIDFYAEPSGEYTIVVKKNGKSEEISYSKYSVSQSLLANHDHISVTQM